MNYRSGSTLTRLGFYCWPLNQRGSRSMFVGISQTRCSINAPRVSIHTAVVQLYSTTEGVA